MIKNINKKEKLGKEILNLLVKMFNQKKMEDHDIKYIEEILKLLLEDPELLKLQILHVLLQKIVQETENGYELFHSYQTITIILQLPKEYLPEVVITIDSFIEELKKSEQMNISDEEKIVLWIDHFFLAKRKNSIKSRTVKSDISFL